MSIRESRYTRHEHIESGLTRRILRNFLQADRSKTDVLVASKVLRGRTRTVKQSTRLLHDPASSCEHNENKDKIKNYASHGPEGQWSKDNTALCNAGHPY
ncbi:hypothetical protein V2G26_006532 [Clonostachys chloroleuca]